MNILAIDPGLANFGWASLISNNLSSGTVETFKTETLHNRLIAITCGVPHQGYDYLVIENCFGPAKTKLDYVIGTIIASVTHKFYVIVSPAKWKRQLCPKGNKDTYGNGIIRLVTKQLGQHPDSQHSADALGLLYWFQHHGLKELDEKS